jgi:hypothetical protein
VHLLGSAICLTFDQLSKNKYGGVSLQNATSDDAEIVALATVEFTLYSFKSPNHAASCVVTSSTGRTASSKSKTRPYRLVIVESPNKCMLNTKSLQIRQRVSFNPPQGQFPHVSRQASRVLESKHNQKR